MKKMYEQPATEVVALKTARLMGDPLLGSPTGPEPGENMENIP